MHACSDCLDVYQQNLSKFFSEKNFTENQNNRYNDSEFSYLRSARNSLNPVKNKNFNLETVKY